MSSAIRIICAQQGAETAALLERVLLAEQRRVAVFSGRRALQELEAPRSGDEIVIVIWSPEAETQPYVREWAARTDPERRIELGLWTPHPPKIQRKAAVIDFTSWRGERGGRAWNALLDRLRAIARAEELARTPPTQAALLLAAAGAVVVGGALTVRLQEPPRIVASAPETTPLSVTSEGVGGAQSSDELLEPPSAAEALGVPRLPPRLATMPRHQVRLDTIEPDEPIELREPTLLERIRDFNPLRRDRNDN